MSYRKFVAVAGMTFFGMSSWATAAPSGISLDMATYHYTNVDGGLFTATTGMFQGFDTLGLSSGLPGVNPLINNTRRWESLGRIGTAVELPMGVSTWTLYQTPRDPAGAVGTTTFKFLPTGYVLPSPSRPASFGSFPDGWGGWLQRSDTLDEYFAAPAIQVKQAETGYISSSNSYTPTLTITHDTTGVMNDDWSTGNLTAGSSLTVGDKTVTITGMSWNDTSMYSVNYVGNNGHPGDANTAWDYLAPDYGPNPDDGYAYSSDPANGPAVYDYTGVVTFDVTPEPATMTLLALGGVACLLRRRRAGSR